MDAQNSIYQLLGFIAQPLFFQEVPHESRFFRVLPLAGEKKVQDRTKGPDSNWARFETAVAFEFWWPVSGSSGWLLVAILNLLCAAEVDDLDLESGRVDENVFVLDI